MKHSQQADEIDQSPPDSSATRVQINAEVSSTTAVHTRGALLRLIERIDPDGEEMWASWPLRRMVNVLDDALGENDRRNHLSSSSDG